MSELSHLGAYRLIHQGHLTDAEEHALQSHLRECASCREHALMAGVLANHFVLQAASTRPAPSFAADYLANADRRSRQNRILKPLYTAGGLAVMILVVLAAWFFIQNSPFTTATADTKQELFDAVLAGDPVEVDRLLSGFKDLDIRNEEGRALLPFAVMTGDLVIVQLLLDHGADVNITMFPSGAGKTGLMEAAINNRSEMVSLLLKEGADVNQQEDESGFSALHYASGLNASEIIGILLENGADPNLRARNGSTPLHSAARYAFIQSTRALIDGGAVVDAPDNEGLTPLMLFIKRGNAYGAPRYFRLLLYHGADPNRQDNDGNSALHHAALTDNSEAIPDLLKYGASLNLKNNDGQTPLELAHYGLTREKLLASTTNTVGDGTLPLDTQLFEAVAAGNTAEAERLLRAGANPNAVNDVDETAVLYHATNNDDRAMVELLLDFGADLNGTLSAGYTALEIAAQNDYLDIVKILLERGADPDQINELWNDGTALHTAANFGRFEAVQMFLDAGADVNMVTDSGMTPLISMIRIGKFGLSEVLPVSELLLDAGTDPNHQDAEGRTALHYAEYGELITLLIEHGANVNLQDNAGETALHRAVRQKNAAAVAVLLEHGADPRLQDNLGRTPLELAPPAGIEELLQRALDE